MRRLIAISSVLLILFSFCLPCFAASAGSDRVAEPVIPMTLELRYPDKTVSMNLTDSIFQNNTVNHDEIIVSGRHLFTSLVTKSTQSDGYLIRKTITSQYSLAPVGLRIYCPTFYLHRHTGESSFTLTVPYIRFPKDIYVEGFITYDLYFGDYTQPVTITREFTSPYGSANNFVLYSFDEINNAASDPNWYSVRISNLNLYTTTFSYGTGDAGNISELKGTWVLEENFDWIRSPDGTESYVNYWIPFRSNGRNFVGITFGDTVELKYFDTVGNYQSVQVWTTGLGWVNEEYRTLYFDGTYDWSDITGSDGFQTWDGANYFKTWLQANAYKMTSGGAYDGGSLFDWRYQTSFNDYATSSLNIYNEAYDLEFELDDVYWEGYNNGQIFGEEIGYQDGFLAGYNEGSGGAFNIGSFLINAVADFFDFQIMPGLSFGGIFGIFISIMIIVAFLKHFAGG